MIAWVCPKPETASGGVAFIHRLARLCQQNGMPSEVWQLEPFDVWWDAEGPFDDVKSYVRETGEPATIVLPEVSLPNFDVQQAREAGDRVVVFIQNHVWANKDPKAYEAVDIVTCSRFLDNWVRRTLDNKPVGMLSPYASAPWRTSPKTKDKTLVIARRNTELAKLMKVALEEKDFPVEFLEEDIRQTALAELLDSCEYYVHLSYPEGIPWAAAEAMLSGTIVCGTTGGGGNEFLFGNETAMVVQDPQNGQYDQTEDKGNAEFVRRIMEQMIAISGDADKRSRMWQNGRNWILGRYTRERTASQLKAIFG